MIAVSYYDVIYIIKYSIDSKIIFKLKICSNQALSTLNLFKGWPGVSIFTTLFWTNSSANHFFSLDMLYSPSYFSVTSLI